MLRDGAGITIPRTYAGQSEAPPALSLNPPKPAQPDACRFVFRHVAARNFNKLNHIFASQSI